MASLDGVAGEWDDSSTVRHRMRDFGLIIVAPPFKDKVVVNVECGEFNYDALAPLARRLQCPKGMVSMHTIPHLMHQILRYS